MLTGGATVEIQNCGEVIKNSVFIDTKGTKHGIFNGNLRIKN